MGDVDVMTPASEDASWGIAIQTSWDGEKACPDDGCSVVLTAGWIASTSRSDTIHTGVDGMTGVNTL
jgi:hypothetical protein